MNKQDWLKAAKQAIEAFKLIKLWRKALGRANTLKSSKLRSIAFRALNYWREVWLDSCLLEQSLRGL